MDELAQRIRDLDAERIRPLMNLVPGRLPPITPTQGRTHFLDLAAALGGLLQADLDYLAAHPISTAPRHGGSL